MLAFLACVVFRRKVESFSNFGWTVHNPGRLTLPGSTRRDLFPVPCVTQGMGMDGWRQRAVARPAWLLGLSLAVTGAGVSQQVLQRGALGAPTQVFDETQQWTTPLPVSGDAEEDVYIPDVSSTPWLARNYADYENKGVYTVSMFAQYKRPVACRRDLVRWGFADAAHLDACVDIGYRVRQITVDTVQKTVTLDFAAMVGQDGQLLQDAVPPQTTTRRWAELDPTALGAITKTNQIVASQMMAYDRRMRGVH